MTPHSITVEVPQVFYECFKKSVSDCVFNGHEIKIVKQEKDQDSNSWIITVESGFPEYFFYLGKRYAVNRNEML